MSIPAMLVALLTSGEVIKFECVHKITHQRRTFFGKGLDINTGQFFDIIRNQLTSLNLDQYTVSYFAESDDSFVAEIERINAFLTTNRVALDTYDSELEQYVIANEAIFGPVVTRCLLFEYPKFQDAFDQNREFVEVVKQKWKAFICEKQADTIKLLQQDKLEFESKQNFDAVSEVESIIGAINSDVAAALTAIESATEYKQLTKIWPSMLLPRPKGA